MEIREEEIVETKIKRILEFEFIIKKDLEIKEIDFSNATCHFGQCEKDVAFKIELWDFKEIEQDCFITKVCKEHLEKIGELNNE